jgi:NADH:ubiquinone oxidoreductase subunit 5 (subunit L)/multisubunit Na+/H+ antiporter MnhA subunit
VVFGDALLRAVPGGGRLVELPWAPSRGLSLSFNLDGLGLLFATLIAGIARSSSCMRRYLAGHAQASRFYASLFAFMGAMLGVVLSANILTLFVSYSSCKLSFHSGATA